MSSRSAVTRTAFGPMVIAACEQAFPVDRRIVDDPLALRLLPAGQRAFVRACRFPSVYRFLVRTTDSRMRGLWAEILCRKRYADDQVAAALRDKIRQFVFLGAGLDTRPYRLVVPAGARAYELDLAANIDYKRRRLTTTDATLLAVDFEKDDLAATLTANGFDPGQPAMIIWEAVTQYLSDEGVRRTLASLAAVAGGSRLIFTYLLRDFLDGSRDYGAARARRDFVTRQGIWRFGLAPQEVAGFLREYGWTEQEQVGAAEYRERYLNPAGRDLPVTEVERFAYAVR